jgi:hypothetical protein
MTRDEAAALLGLAADADPATVRHAWRLWARVAHPDVGGDPGHFARLEEARRVLMQPLPVVLQPTPRPPWSSVIHAPTRPTALVGGAVAATMLALLPSLAGGGIIRMAATALPAALAAAGWSMWAARNVLAPDADRGHLMATLALAWLPLAAAQQLLAAAAGAALIAVLPVMALPFVVVVGTVNPGAGLWRPIGAMGP